MDINEALLLKAVGLMSSAEFKTYARLNKFGEIF